MTVNIVSVHDLGKINPNFQSDKMHHKWHEEVKPDPNIGSRHSILSSVFYLDYFLGKINEMWGAKQLIKKSEAEILKDFAYIYSYIISRHHGELKEFETYMANNRRLQVEKHFDKQVNYCVLNEEGRKIFIESFEERLESVFMHPKLKRKVSYRTALKLDCYKLIKNILEEKEFVPFSLKEGM